MRTPHHQIQSDSRFMKEVGIERDDICQTMEDFNHLQNVRQREAFAVKESAYRAEIARLDLKINLLYFLLFAAAIVALLAVCR